MGNAVAVDAARLKALGVLVRETNPSLSDWDVSQVIGEVVMGRAMRFSQCPLCGGRGRVVGFDNEVPVWKDCECARVRSMSSLDGVPLNGEGVLPVLSEVLALRKSLDAANAEVARLRLDVQQQRQVALGAQEAIAEVSRQNEALEGALRSSCKLLLRVANNVDEFLGDEILKFVGEQ